MSLLRFGRRSAFTAYRSTFSSSRTTFGGKYRYYCTSIVTKHDVEEYIANKKGDYTLIDVRNPDEHLLGVIPTAKTIPCKY